MHLLALSLSRSFYRQRLFTACFGVTFIVASSLNLARIRNGWNRRNAEMTSAKRTLTLDAKQREIESVADIKIRKLPRVMNNFFSVSLFIDS